MAAAQKKTSTAKTGSKSNSKTESQSRKDNGAGKRPGALPAEAERAPGRSTGSRTGSHVIKSGILLFLGLFFLVGYFPADALLLNPICGMIKGLIGYGYYLLPPALIAAAAVVLLRRGRPSGGQATALISMPIFASGLIHCFAIRDLSPIRGAFGLFVSELYDRGKELHSGGVLGGLLGWGGRALLGPFLTAILLLIILAALFITGFRISLVGLWEQMQEDRERRKAILAEELEEEDRQALARRRTNAAREQTVSPAPAAQPASAKGKRNEQRSPIDIPTEADEADKVPIETFPDDRMYEIFNFNSEPQGKASAPAPTPVPLPMDEPVPAPAPVSETAAPQPPARTSKAKLTPPSRPTVVKDPSAAVRSTAVKPLSIEEAADIAGVELSPLREEVHAEEFSTDVVRSIRSNAKKGMDTEELIQETSAVAKAVEEKDAAIASEPVYRFPPAELLHAGSALGPDGSEEIALNRGRLQSTLDSFGVNATIVDITRGPTVTRYDLELEAGVKLAKLTNLAGDLALSLGVTGVRIAPIPDKSSTVGIEVPNKLVSTVYLRDIIDTDVFRAAKSKLTFAIGKDIGGNAIVGNISKLPHLLIAGTTGSGKSVCMNCLILSLLYKATPEEVRLIMIDPKMVELGVYNGIPHLYIPVVTDPKKAAGSLQWAVVEMLKRYRLFSEAGIRDLAGYNAIQKKNGTQPLPQVVIVIDELADLMMVASKEVEESICRVAQMGRAAGMHLVIATQRPSADVITGLMKANIPSRIAFAVSSSMESRIILDQMGAEKLVGSGDMLFAPIGIGKPNRIQGAFVTDEEREEIVGFIKQQGEPNYSEEILSSIEQAAAEKDSKDKSSGGKAESVDGPVDAGGGYDELLPQAVDVIFETKQASVSMLQRRLKLGYSRAARIVDQMEEIGVLGPFEGSKPRQILLTREQWLEMQTVQGTAPTEKSPTSFADYEDAPPEEWTD